MKKLLFVLVCAASLGFWMSCNNGAQELDVTLHSGIDAKSYTNVGTVTAKKVTMVTKRGEKVTYDKDHKMIKPTDPKYYFGVVQKLVDGKLETEEYWFYNDWDAGTEITFESAKVGWSDDVSYWGDGIATGHETVQNAKWYNFSFELVNDDVNLDESVTIRKSGDVYQYDDDTDSYGTAALEVSGNLEGNFEIKTLLKKLDSKYYEEDAYGEFSGTKYQRLDERTVYEYVYTGDVWDSEIEDFKPNYELKTRKIPANTGNYYYTDVKFTKN